MAIMSRSLVLSFFVILYICVVTGTIGATNNNDLNVIRELQTLWPGTSKIWGANDPCVDAWKGVCCSYNQTSQEFRISCINLIRYNLTTNLPVILANLTELVNLTLAQAQLTGSLQNYPFGSLTKLERIFLYQNQFTGELPATLPTSLLVLDLSSNQIVDTFADHIYGTLPNFQTLALRSNQLSGELPTNFPQTLITIDLSSNQLNGSVPASFFSGILFPNLVEVYLYSNKLTGSLPPFVNATSIRYVALQNNQLTGPLPVLNETNSPIIENFHLDDNFLEDQFSDTTLGYLPQLVWYSISKNQGIGGLLPSNIFSTKCPQLQNIDISYNFFTGPLPTQLSPNLINFHAESNTFSGELPTSWGNPGNGDDLEELLLSKNKLVGSIPANWANLKSLQELTLSYNLLTGPIPDFLQNISFNGACNEFDEPLPDWCDINGACISCTTHSTGKKDDLKYLWFLLIPACMFVSLIIGGVIVFLNIQKKRQGFESIPDNQGTSSTSRWQDVL